MPDGSVLVVGGISAPATPRRDVFRLYPGVGLVLPADALQVARASHAAVGLDETRLMVIGGARCSPVGRSEDYLASTEVFDSATNRWSEGPALATPRAVHSATLLLDGRVLVVGGFVIRPHERGGVEVEPTSRVEIYDPALRAWLAGPPTAEPQVIHTATRLRDGRVLVAGGLNSAQAEIFNPVENAWQLAAPMPARVTGPTAVLLSDGRVLVAGGHLDREMTARAFLYDPERDEWQEAPPMHHRRANHSAVSLPDGSVLVIGGYNYEEGRLAETERFRVTPP
jgi:hypothetical protein